MKSKKIRCKKEVNTMLRKFKISVCCCTAIFLFSSGIYRHDVDVQAHIDLGNQPQLQCVGQIISSGELRGSCVIIQERIVLTAAHVLKKSETRADAIDFEGTEAIVYTELASTVLHPEVLRIKIDDRQFGVKSVLCILPFWQNRPKGVCDIAILELTEPVVGISFPRLNAFSNELHADAFGVGYGASGPANRPDLVAPKSEKIAGQNVIDSIGGYALKGKPTLLFADFDHPTDTTCCNRMGSPTPKPLEFITAGGDSGGGLFRYKNDEWELIGITAGGGIELEHFMKSFYYGQIASWTRVSVLHE